MAPLGIGVGLAVVPVSPTVLTATRRENRGVAPGLLQAALTVGAVGPALPLIPYNKGGRGTGRRRPGRLRLERGDRGPVPADRGGLLVPAGAAGAGGGVRRQASRPAAITAAV
ncbi:hypothetical protein SJI45_04125 [Streptomyces sp. S399]|uniref:hypothetical protein n=1 Tax=Streptomyces sp. S399 TaxID=3096009 RepID=UPI002A812FAC|nr:hypothetical protein [Streptomyces sp. S399]WPR50392.1 hypothetical protein SJI45_04125 [Streptomyces sp. S399]